MGRYDKKIKTENFQGVRTLVPENDGTMQYLSMKLLNMSPGDVYTIESETQETGMVIISGSCELNWKESNPVSINSRNHPLEQWPHAVYVPTGKKIRITAKTAFNAALFGTDAPKEDKDVQIIYPDDCKVLDIGNGNWYLQGTFMLGEDGPSNRLILGETHIPAGNWSSYPPHSHSEDIPGKESRLEEIYHFRFKPDYGFGFQGLYTLDDEIDEAYIIRDGDTVLIPKGMHPNVTGPGYEMYMLWGMAGPSGKEWIPFEDPNHNWIGSVKG